MDVRAWDRRPGQALGWCVIGVAALVLIGRSASIGQQPTPAALKAEDLRPSNDRMPHDPEAARRSVAFWEGLAAKDPRGAFQLRELAGAYLASQRETGDIADAVKAEDAARRSLKIHSRGNTGAAIRLARALLSQHRFPEALKVAVLAAQASPEGSRLLADIRLELGDYDEALEAMNAVPVESDDMNAKALRARFEEIDGRPERSLGLMREARDLADQRPDMPAEVVAWYHTMVGHSLIDSGQLEEGEAACRKALEVFPRDYRAMTGMAEAATWRGDHKGAIDWARKAIEVAPQNPEALRLIGDAHAALGQAVEAEAGYKLLETLARSFPRIYDRHWIIFCVDNDKNLDEALALARKDLELRHDIHAYDALAWACFKKGLLPEADRLMGRALSRGTRKASLEHHAGLIARAVGDKGRAESHLARARELNPYLMKAPDESSKPSGRG